MENNGKTPEVRQELQPKIKVSKTTVKSVIVWAAILVVFIFITNPALIPFLPQETKEAIRETWNKFFGDIDAITGTLSINVATVFQVIAVIIVTALFITLVNFILDRIKPKKAKTRSVITLLRSAVKYLGALVGFFWCLSAIGVNVSTIFASVGIVALIIGFGAQSMVEDLVTGIFLVFEDQFNVGDIIEINGFRGTVMSIGIRTTCIKDIGNNVKIINNSDLRNILNRSTSNSYAVTTVSISYSQDIEKAEAVIADLLPAIRAKYPEVFVADPIYSGVQELGSSGVLLKFVALVDEKDIFSAPRLLNREIKLCFDKNGIEIPFTQVVIHEAKD